MRAKSVFYIMIIAICGTLTLGLAVGLYGYDLWRTQANDLTSQKLQNITLNSEQTSLALANKDVEKYTALDKIAQSIVPQEKDQALAVRELTNLAVASGISFSSISFPQSNLGQSKLLKDSQLLTVSGVNGVYEMPITLQSDVKKPVAFSQIDSFLQSLENNRLTAQVGQLTITPSDSSGSKLSFEIVVNAYIRS